MLAPAVPKLQEGVPALEFPDTAGLQAHLELRPDAGLMLQTQMFTFLLHKSRLLTPSPIPPRIPP